MMVSAHCINVWSKCETAKRKPVEFLTDFIPHVTAELIYWNWSRDEKYRA